MIRFSTLLLSALLLMALWPGDNADARRFGGGLSFGSHSRAFAPGHRQQPSHSASRPASSRAAAAGNARPRSGFMGAIAGLAMGGLLGAMLFGGAFDGINAFDLLIIAAIGFGLLWWFRRKAQQVASHAPSGSEIAGAQAAGRAPGNHHSYVGNGNMFMPSEQGSAPAQAQQAPQIDQAQFLDASRTIFVRMQTAWDKQDIKDIARFCLPEVVAHVKQELAEQGDTRNITEVVSLEAELLEIWCESGREWAAVAFTAMMNEQTLYSNGQNEEKRNARIQEIWTFCHDQGSDDPTWFVAGIAQQPA